MTALSDAERAVAEARRDVHEYFVLFAAPVADEARAKVARLEAAVRHRDAEIARAEPLEEVDGFVIRPDFRAAWEEGRNLAGDAISGYAQPAPLPEVEVRYADGLSFRLRDFEVDVLGERRLEIEGRLTSGTSWPRPGAAVRLGELGIPGRGLLADVTASISLASRGDATFVRIRVSLDPKEPTP